MAKQGRRKGRYTNTKRARGGGCKSKANLLPFAILGVCPKRARGRGSCPTHGGVTAVNFAVDALDPGPDRNERHVR